MSPPDGLLTVDRPSSSSARPSSAGQSRSAARHAVPLVSTEDPAAFNQTYGPIMAEFLIEASEVESRLRQHVLELIEPTMRKQVAVERKVKDFRALIQTDRTDIDDLISTRDATDSINTILDNFRVELAEWDRERHEHEMKVSTRISGQEVEINGLRQSLEMLKGVDHSSVHRTLQNMGDMLTQYKDESTELRRFCTERIDLSRDKTLKLRDEFETRTLAMENQMHCLQDMQTQTNTSITHINELVEMMDHRTKKAGEGIADLWRAKVSVACLEEQQQDLSEFMQHVNGIVSSLKQQFGSLIDDVKAHFETATQLVGRSTAEQMNVMRTKYQDDLHRVDTLRNEMSHFVSTQKVSLEEMGSEVKSTRETTSATLQTLSATIEKLRQQREVDQKMAEIDMGQLRMRLNQCVEAGHANAVSGGGAHPVSGGNAGGGGGASGLPVHNRDALATFLESASIGVACDMQDEKDRKGLALFGAKPVMPIGQGAALPDILSQRGTMQYAAGSPRRAKLAKAGTTAAIFGTVPEEGASDQAITFDNRCLSCTGSSATVLASFKMACLRYEPGQVEYEGSLYSRSELMGKRIELLEQARAILKHGKTLD